LPASTVNGLLAPAWIVAAEHSPQKSRIGSDVRKAPEYAGRN
jgi:hypothetical protein